MNLAILIAASLIILSTLSSKLSGKLGIPGLLLFLIIGMLAGSDGPGGIPFEDYALTQFLGVVALIYILYSGGLDTRWSEVKAVTGNALSLATLGVMVTTVVVAVAARWLFYFSWLEGLLMGAIVSSTDASAVFTVLKERALGLKGRIKPLLEFESGINDPMAVFLTIGFVTLLQQPDLSWTRIVPLFFQQMVLGLILGFVLGRLSLLLFNRINLAFDGLYSVLSSGIAIFVYGLTAMLGGSGFLAVYLVGLILGNSEFIHKRSIMQFHDGVAWLVSIGMFLILGLLVFPSQLSPIVWPALLLSFVLIFIARPAGVFSSLLLSSMPFNEKTMVAWVGLRGAVPIILATFPLLASIPNAQLIFNVTFFVVVSSVLIQSTTLPLAAKLFRVKIPFDSSKPLPLGYTPTGRNRNDLVEFVITPHSILVGKRIVDANIPPDVLVVLIYRNDEYIIPRGSTELQAGDVIQMLGSKTSLAVVQARSG